MHAIHRVVGVMSGTSIDAVDCALCRCERERLALVRTWSRPMPRPMARRLHAIARGDATSWECGQAHHDLGRLYADVVAEGLGRTRVDAVGLHGQTVFHKPGGRSPATWQLGEPAWLARRLGVPVVSNFRAADMAAGGQGAPLATLFHEAAFSKEGAWTAVQNLGGIGNVTWIDRTRARTRRLSFDTGPANVLLDIAARLASNGRESFDRDGRRASAGHVDERRLAAWLRDPFLRRKPPKSTGRERFGEPFMARILRDWPEALADGGHDLMATLVAFTARSVALNYEWHLPPPSRGSAARVIVAGGGASNPALMSALHGALEAVLPGVELRAVADLGWPTQSVEPAAFAWLADRHLRGLPGNVPNTTGARRACMLGTLTPP